MKKLIIALGIISGFCAIGHANPLDVPYQIYFSTVVINSVSVSTATFPSASTTVNSKVGLSQWCIEDVIVSAPNSASTFTMFSSTSALVAGTTDFAVVTSTGVPLQLFWNYRDPYCAPIGNAVLTLKSSVSGSTITAQGYLWKGWN